MKLKNILIILTIVLFLSSFVVADSSYDTYGNEANNFGSGSKYLLWGNNFPNGTTNYNEIISATSNDFTPFVFKPATSDEDNLIFTFASNSIIVYDKNLNIVSSDEINGTLRGQPCTLNLNNDNTIELVLPIFRDNITYLGVYNYVNSNFELNRNYIVPNFPNADLLCNVIDTSKYVIMYNETTDGIKLFTYDLDVPLSHPEPDNLSDILLSDVKFYGNMNRAEAPYYNHPISYGELNTDGHFEIMIVGLNSSSATQQWLLNVYDPVSKNLDIKNKQLYTKAITKDCEDITVNPAQIGTDGSLKEIVVSVDTHRTQNDRFISIIDSTKAIKFNYNSSNDGISTVSVSDVDLDGSNDYCFFLDSSNSFRCYDSTYNIMFNSNVNVIDRFFSMSDMVQGTNYQELITRTGIYVINDTGIESRPYNLTNTLDVDTPAVVLSIVSPNLYTKDVLYYNKDSITILSNQSLAYVCGDGVCQGTETIITCYTDCITGTPEVVLNGSEAGEPCTTKTDCKSNLCEYGTCTLKTEGLNCISDAQCLSGECSSGKCTDVTLWTKIDASKTQQFGDDTQTNLFISFGLIIFLVGAIIFMTRSVVGVIIGVIIFMVGVIFFTIVGWISAWILFAIVFFFIFMMFVGWILLKGAE